MLTCAEQLVEVREVTRRVAVALRIKPAQAGRLVNSLRDLAVVQTDLPAVQRSPDHKDDSVWLWLKLAAHARWSLGYKSGLIALHQHPGAELVTAADFVMRCLN